eukprot:TRINITY_DN28526_c0_g2_i1.p1 TRINITY_DN28526_c0_g2~~TRINITY_DN28526_c0_g2_i1.p1  ORF type:complete len:222 (-),score=39.93 TRINITY_DN28526_c0_g2_i1:35-700(-)
MSTPQQALNELFSDWKRYKEESRKQQSRRRGICALALIAEPDEYHWNEIFVDTLWSAWSEAVTEARFEKALLAGRQRIAETHESSKKEKFLRRRAIFALALISEPFQREWLEIHLDLVWTAWKDFIEDLRFKKVETEILKLSESSRYGEFTCSQSQMQTVFDDCGLKHMTSSQLQLLLGKTAAKGLSDDELKKVLCKMPFNPEGVMSIVDFLDWLFDSNVK